MMKKLITVALVLILALSLSACGKKAPQTAELTLASNPTTGYEWSAFQSSDLFEISGDYIPDSNDEQAVGVGGKQVFTLKPLKAGKCEVSFVYQRPWEAIELGDHYVYQITVTKDLQIRVESAAMDIRGTMEELPPLPDFVIR